MALLEIKGLKKNFGDLKVLKDVNMKIEEGEVLVLIGPSGSGKNLSLDVSTLGEDNSVRLLAEAAKMQFKMK